MNYEVFLVSGMREEWVHTGAARGSVIDGARHSVRVVTAAALIKPIAFALAVAIDAFAVRLTLVSAVLALAGRHAWWLPAWLDRFLLDLDVEGTRLQKAPETEHREPERVS
ncbi:membrane transporter [Streptomyces sp. AC495_CC817]|uniref:membrane transporter n=1 Tax=Streptomyces sp. AC495_CC817 TaxID=2823900 RepID=UPI0035A8DD0E